jgi:hypothetical protein
MSLLSLRCAALSRRSRALTILVGQHESVDLGMLDLDSYTTPVVPDMGGKGKRKTPSLRSSKAPSRSTHTLVRDSSRSSRRSPPPSTGFSLPPGRGEKTTAATCCHLSFPMPRMSSPGRLLDVSGTGSSEKYRPYPLLVVHVARGRPLCWAVCFRGDPSTPSKALMSMVGTDVGRGWLGEAERGSDLKDAAYGSFNQTLCT